MPLTQDRLIVLLLQRRPAVLGYLASIVGDLHVAEDLYQEVAVLATQKRAEIEGEDHLVGWLMHTARFMALNAARKEKTRRHVFGTDLLETLESEWAADVSDSADSRLAMLQRCIERLTPRSRRLVELRYFEGLSGESLAEQVERSMNSVYVSLSRIHRALAKCVEREQRLSEA